ncbi:MAG: class I SAM-dependent RNA methyltransferase [candidate division Zixibacteria bacterium]|nr:class I SAM-dependent RNA methyltransferase [candidate division Zixibacteria bacterium]
MARKTASSKHSFRIVAKTLYGLESILARELTDLGASRVREMVRSVEFYGDMELLYNANLWCRTATRIIMPIVGFTATDEHQLYREVLKIPWEKWLSLRKTFAIDAVLVDTKFDNSLYVAQKTKDAIADRFRKVSGQRPSVDLKRPDMRINVYIYKDECTLALDSSGGPLFKRGYRTKTGKAPLNEVLAAGIVLQSGWDRKSSFVDAMCGSGTIVIEAGLIARNIAPGIRRKSFGFMNWPDFDRELFESLQEKARKKMLPSLNFKMLGSDKSSRQAGEAAGNARQAGLEGDIEFRHCPIADLVPPPAPGVLIINPPYGERMAVEEINDFYHDIGDALKKNFTDYDAFVFTGNMAAAKHIGLRTSRRIEMYNGSIECRLLKYEMYRGTRKVKADDGDQS